MYKISVHCSIKGTPWSNTFQLKLGATQKPCVHAAMALLIPKQMANVHKVHMVCLTPQSKGPLLWICYEVVYSW